MKPKTEILESGDIPWKKKKDTAPLEEDGILFDSKEEQWFYWQLLELKNAGLVDAIKRDISYTLSGKVSHKTGKSSRTLLKPHVYTPDFVVKWSAFGVASALTKKIDDDSNALFIIGGESESHFEVKPGFDASGTITKASINIKWLFDKHGIFVHLAQVSTKAGSWFDKTWTPKRFSVTEKTLQQRRLGYCPIFISEFLEKVP